MKIVSKYLINNVYQNNLILLINNFLYILNYIIELKEILHIENQNRKNILKSDYTHYFDLEEN